MAGKLYDHVMKTLKADLENMWFEKPPDIENLKKRVGTMKLHFTPVIGAYHEVYMVDDKLWCLREAAKEDVELGPLLTITRKMIRSSAGRFGSFFNMPITSDVLFKAADSLSEIENKKEYLDLVETLVLYSGRLITWMNVLIPWQDLGSFYETLLEDQS